MSNYNIQHNPEISVIIPCYNCARWIIKCLDALQAQSFKRFEVICIDDCSTDQTSALIQEYRQKSGMTVRLFYNDLNSGPAISRNIGAENARGKYLAFCDADDWFDSCFLEEMFQKAKIDDSDIVMCEYKKVFESEKKTVSMNYLSSVSESSTKEDLIAISRSSFGLLFIKKELFLSGRIPDLRNGEDIAYVPVLQFRAGKISVIKKAMYNYLIREQSVSNKVNSTVYQSLAAAFRYIEENFTEEYPYVLEYLGIRTVLYGVTMNALKAGVSITNVKTTITDFEKKYPEWDKNKYIDSFTESKKIYLSAVKSKNLWMCKIMAKIHMRLSV